MGDSGSVTVVNFPDCHRKTVTSFVEDCLKKKNTQNPKTSDTLKLRFLGKFVSWYACALLP